MSVRSKNTALPMVRRAVIRPATRTSRSGTKSFRNTPGWCVVSKRPPKGSMPLARMASSFSRRFWSSSLSDWTCSCMGKVLIAVVNGTASLTESAHFATAKVAPHVTLDSRLALWHERDRWLACSDLHFGHELKQRSLGGLFPLWGMRDIETRLRALLAHYQPRKLILVGDIMDCAGTAEETLALVANLSRECEVICIAGNHDHPSLQRCSGFVR